MAKMALREKVERKIARSVDSVFLREEFDKLGGYDQVGRVLRDLVKEGLLKKAGYGIYVKTKLTEFGPKRIPVTTLQDVGFQVMTKMGVKADLGLSARDYRDGKSTQMPMAAVLNVGKARIKRRIAFGSNVIRYEK